MGVRKDRKEQDAYKPFSQDRRVSDSFLSGKSAPNVAVILRSYFGV